MNKIVQTIDKDEITLGSVSEIIVLGDPGCSKFDDHSKSILGEIFKNKADAFIILGDMAYRGNTDELSEIVLFCNVNARAPVYAVCGNHDLPDYPVLFGSSTYAIRAGTVIFLFIDNVTDREHISQKDIEFIAKQFDKHAGKRFIICFHIPPPTDLAPKHMNDQKWGELKAVLDKYKDRVECLMCGHIHGFREQVIDGYRVFITGGGGAKLHTLDKDIIKSHHAVKIKIDRSGSINYEVIRVGETNASKLIARSS